MTNAPRKRCSRLVIRRVRRLPVTSFASGMDIKTVQTPMRHASGAITLDTYGHLWPHADESTRTAVGARYRGADICCVPAAYRDAGLGDDERCCRSS